MRTRHHPLLGPSCGTRRRVTSLHFGTPGTGPKAVLQASLHADEVPPMLVAHHLRVALARLERAGRLRGEVVLVPAANPIGLSQRVLHAGIGRFDLASGENFNRRYPDLTDAVAQRLAGPGAARAADVASLRAALREACAALPAADELQSLRRTLLSLAIDADTVLDLHCDNEAVLHVYTTPALWPHVEPLARALRCPLALLADGSGGEPFDEACSLTWSRLVAGLPERARAAATATPPCVAATVELRGEVDVRHDLAAADAHALIGYLRTRGHVAPVRPGEPLDASDPRPGDAAADGLASPAARPLAGSMPVVSPTSGVVVYLRELGATVRAGEPLAEIVDPVAGRVARVASPVDGLFYARESRRFVHAGGRIAKVAGLQPLRTGRLMAA
jgi:hypothetical protein